MSITDKIRKQSRPKVSSQIDSVARLPAQRGTDAEDQKEQRERDHVAGPEVRVVLDGENHKDEDGARDDLGEELARRGQEGLGVRAKDPRGRRVAVPWHRADSGAPLVRVDGGLVVAVDDGGAAEAPRDLGAGVYRELPPGEPAEDAVDHGYGRVEVTSGAARDVDS